MTKRIFTALTTICLLVAAFPTLHFAQERLPVNIRQPINGRKIGPIGPVGQKPITTAAEAEKAREDLTSFFTELESLLKLYAEYPGIRDSSGMIGYEEVLNDITDERKKLELSSVQELMQNPLLASAKVVKRATTAIKQARNNDEFLPLLSKANKSLLEPNKQYSSAGLQGMRKASVMAVPPARYLCNYDDPNSFPSPAEIAIFSAITIALEAAYNAIPDDLFTAIIKIALAVAVGVAALLTLGLETANAVGSYCEALRFFIEDKMKDNDGPLVIMAVPYSEGGYLDYAKDSVRAIYNEALGRGFPVNCAMARLTEGDNYFNSGQWLQAYKKYQAAYQNIGASSCIE
ncbi:MAG: hypothetical protein ACKVZH_25875 [Blastocatellia bacterium]